MGVPGKHLRRTTVGRYALIRISFGVIKIAHLHGRPVRIAQFNIVVIVFDIAVHIIKIQLQHIIAVQFYYWVGRLIAVKVKLNGLNIFLKYLIRLPLRLQFLAKKQAQHTASSKVTFVHRLILLSSQFSKIAGIEYSFIYSKTDSIQQGALVFTFYHQAGDSRNCYQRGGNDNDIGFCKWFPGSG